MANDNTKAIRPGDVITNDAVRLRPARPSSSSSSSSSQSSSKPQSSQSGKPQNVRK